jgi:hypothetical protein
VKPDGHQAGRPDGGKRELRMIVWSGVFLLVGLVALIFHGFYLSRTFEDHLAAGGVDDPDAVIDRGHLAVVLLEILIILVAGLGLVIATFRYLVQRARR